ncbi:hypothetical protein [Serratia sp. C2(1)]|nr:hypothetical protein [Serratia sp. C2(2)]MEE4446354.1 hypothetical protein [Serratia sp. C2(1)]
MLKWSFIGKSMFKYLLIFLGGIFSPLNASAQPQGQWLARCDAERQQCEMFSGELRIVRNVHGYRIIIGQDHQPSLSTSIAVDQGKPVTGNRRDGFDGAAAELMLAVMRGASNVTIAYDSRFKTKTQRIKIDLTGFEQNLNVIQSML